MEALAPECELRGWFLAPPKTEVRGIRPVLGKKVFVARRKQLRADMLAEHPDRPDALFSGFRVAVQLDVGWNELELQFKDGDRGWRPFCHCHLRLPWLWKILRRFTHRAAASGYETWTRQYGDPDAKELRAMRGFLGRFPKRPLLSILMPVHNTEERWLRRAIESVKAQVYPHWELCIADDCSVSPGMRRLLSGYARDPTMTTNCRPMRCFTSHGNWPITRP